MSHAPTSSKYEQSSAAAVVATTSSGGSDITKTLKALARYLAYMSDVGEAFRPIVHVNAVRSAYGVSWAYVIGDVAADSYDKYYRCEFRGWDLAHTTTKRAMFQTIASMALPAFTIHSVVRYTKRLVFAPRFPQYLRWGPTFCGLGIIPFLPFMYDHPVEWACNRFWDSSVPLSDRARAMLKKEHEEELAAHGGH